MGSGSDVHTKIDTIENSYLRDSHGIERLLRSYYIMHEKSRYQFDQSASTLIIDLESALDKDIFTPHERQALSLVYFAQLDIRQAARTIGVKTHEIIDAISEAIEKIGAILMGFSAGDLPRYLSKQHSFERWIESVGKGEAPIYHIPNDANNGLLRALAEKGDQLAVETLRQRVEGPPIVEDKPYCVEDYPFYTDQQFKNMDRNLNVTFLSKKEIDKIALGRTVVGSRKVAFNDDESDDFDEGTRQGFGPRVVKAKIYKY
ncbi:hypothetical protein ACIQX3_21325 [Peribacillus frigoritolerans]|uniref:hypothetical protein n=1 Tax=Peribacillus frigoritolerans TaxID=450367 RepID=UPI0037F84066